jgi:hypothetical protein
MEVFQAQDYLSILWAIGLRTKNSTMSSVEKAISGRVIVRYPLLRNTIHIVPAANYSWMLALVREGCDQPSITSPVRTESDWHDCVRPGIWLLPSYDEYTLGYRDRSPIFGPDLESKKPARQARIALANVIVADGKIIGSWKRTVAKRTVHIIAVPFRPLGSSNQKLLKAAIEQYGDFLGRSSTGVIKG